MWLAAPLLLLPAGVNAAEPLYVKNLSPLAGVLGLPSQRSASTGAAGEFSLALHGSLASHYVEQLESPEYVKFDGETQRFALAVRYAVTDTWELELELPWLRHSGGHLDSLIDGWHDLWGMSDGGRSDTPRDQLRYRYLSPATDTELVDDHTGTGDISIALGHSFYRSETLVASITAGYKFGQGNDRAFMGSGADDAYLALRASSQRAGAVGLQWHAQLGYLHAGASDLLGSGQERELWFAGTSLDWAFNPSWSVIAQLDAHAAPLASELTAVGDTAIMLSLGGRWQFSPQWSLDLSVVEDVQVETAPDVIFQASLRFTPGS